MSSSGRGPGRPTGADGAETRRRILLSARRVFSSIGFDCASLREIAADAGLTRNAIANYYPGKVELHAAAFASIQEEAIGTILAEASAESGPVNKRIMALFRSAVAMNEIDDTFVRFLITSTVDAVHHPELRDHSMRQLAAVRTYIWDTLTVAAEEGEISTSLDTEAAAQVFTDLLWGLAMDAGFLSDTARVGQTLAALESLVGAALDRGDPGHARSR